MEKFSIIGNKYNIEVFKIGVNTMYYVYLYLDPRTKDTIYGFEPFYVGKGTKNRLSEHLKEAENLTLQHPKLSKIRKLKKLNLDPIIKIYKEFDNEDDAYKLEKELIESIGSDFIDEIKNGPLTNLIPGGHGGGCSYIWTDEKRKELSEKMKGTNRGSKNGMYGKKSPRKGIKQSEEECEKIRNKVKKYFEKNGLEHYVSKTIYMFMKDGTLLNKFNNVNDIEKIYSIKRATILSSAKTDGQRITSGFRWSFNKEIKIKPKNKTRHPNSLKNLLITRSKKIAMIDKTTNEVLQIFSSGKEAIEKTGFKGIPDAVNPKRKAKTAGGFIWQYV